MYVDFIDAINKALDKVEAESKGIASCLVTTSTGKYYSNGLDLEWLMEQQIGGNAQENLLRKFHLLLHRFLTFPMPCVAAVNGHAFAGGFLLALTHDYRVMNIEKGFACMSEIDIAQRLTLPLASLIKEKLARRFAAKMMLEGSRFNAKELLDEKAIDAAVPGAEVLPTAIEIGTKFAPKASSGVYGKMKEDMYSDAVKMLKNGPVFRSPL